MLDQNKIMEIKKLNCYFIHIPKTAGTSIFRFLNKYCTADEKLEYNRNPHRIEENCENLFKFCFVRNPWDRFVSCYFYFRKYGQKFGNDEHTGDLVNKFESFTEFVHNYESIKSELRCPHFKCQTHWMKNKIDFIGRVENFEDDFNEVCDIIKITRHSLDKKNKSYHNHYTTHYNFETKKIIEKLYEDDVKTFNYNFD